MLNLNLADKIEELSIYQPEFYRDILEIREINRIAGKHACDLDNAIDKFRKNCFLDTLDEHGIKRWEKILLLIPKGNLIQRRNTIISTLSGGIKLDKNKIIQLSKFYTEEKANVIFKDSTIFILYNRTPLDDLTPFIAELKILAPCHLFIGFREIIFIKMGINTLKTAMNLKHMDLIKLGLDFKKEKVIMNIKDGCRYFPDGVHNPQTFDYAKFDGVFNWDGEINADSKNPYGKRVYIDRSFSVGYIARKHGQIIGGGNLDADY